jgi:hypothetical protein
MTVMRFTYLLHGLIKDFIVAHLDKNECTWRTGYASLSICSHEENIYPISVSANLPVTNFIDKIKTLSCNIFSLITLDCYVRMMS